MKKKQIIYLFLVVCLGAFYGCSQEGFDTYQSENYIHFNKSENDSTTFSFAYDPSLTEGEVDIKLNILIGILRFKVQKLCYDQTCGRIVNLLGQHDYAVVEKS